MTPLAQFITELGSGLPKPVGSASSGVQVYATEVSLRLPIEARIDRTGELHASLPRGRMATGFDLPLGRLEAHFELRDAEEARP